MAKKPKLNKRITDPGKPMPAKTLAEARKIQAENERRLKS